MMLGKFMMTRIYTYVHVVIKIYVISQYFFFLRFEVFGSRKLIFHVYLICLVKIHLLLFYLIKKCNASFVNCVMEFKIAILN